MNNILITGGAGFIGSTFVAQSVERGDNVIVLDALTYAGNYDNISWIENFKFIEGNICDSNLVNAILGKHNINQIVNFAAESHVDNSINNSNIFIETNILGTHTLLEAARKHFANNENCRFIQISTDEVYGELNLGSDEKFSETTNYQPNSPYSASKAAGDHLARAWYHTYKLPVITSNCSNNYGPRQHTEKLIPHMINCAISDKPLPVYGDGKNVRDWIHVEDHCNGIYLALSKGRPGQTYCFGGNAERDNLSLVQQICSILDKLRPKDKSYSEQISFVKDRAGHDRRYAIDDSKAQKDLGFTRTYNFEDGLTNTVKWYLENQF